jgi:hypothetical protein
MEKYSNTKEARLYRELTVQVKIEYKVNMVTLTCVRQATM